MTQKVLQLRPMSVGDLLDVALRLYRRYFLLFIGIVAVIQVPLAFIELGYELTLSPAEELVTILENPLEYYSLGSDSEISQDAELLLGSLVMFVVNFILVQGLINGAMARAVYDRYLGQPLGLVDTYHAVGRRLLRLAGALVVLGVVDVGIFLLVFIPCIGWIVALILLVYVNVPILSFLAPVIVLEDRGVWGGIGRAFDLGRQQFWRVLGVNFLLGLLTWIVSFVLSLSFEFGLALWEPSYTVRLIIMSLVNLAVAIVVQPVQVCGLTLLYFDLRVRLEGFDLELMAQEMVADPAE